MSTLTKSLLGQRDGWQRRGMEATLWQELGIAWAREVGRQLAWHSHVQSGLDGAPVVVHDPYD